MKKDDRKQDIRNLISLLKIFPKSFFFIVFITILRVVVEAFAIGLLLPLIDNSTDQQVFSGVPFLGMFSSFFSCFSPHERLRSLSFFIAIFAIARGFVNCLFFVVSASLEFYIQTFFQEKAYNQYNRHCLGDIHSKESSEFIGLINYYPQQVKVIFSQLTAIASALVAIFIYTFLSVLINWRLTLLIFLMILPTCCFFYLIFSKKTKALGKDYTLTVLKLNQWIFESCKSHLFIRGMGKEDRAKVLFSNYLKKMKKAGKKNLIVKTIFDPLVNSSIFLVISLSIYLSTYFLKESQEVVPQIFIFLAILTRLMGPISVINIAKEQISSYSYQLNLLLSFIDGKEKKVQQKVLLRTEYSDQNIYFENVDFFYPISKKQVLKKVSFSIKKNSMTAFVGPSGVGKSTIINLLLKLYTPTSGHILVGSHFLKDLSKESWSKKISYVPQEPFLFNDTIKNNFKFIKEDVKDGEIMDACKLANAHEFIEFLPNKYKTVIGENGVKLSGGQKQRLSIARALVVKPKLLILDEVTSNLDASSERTIIKVIESLIGRVTIIVIAHRLSTIRNAEKIILLERGEIREQGSHRELIEKGGKYQEFFTAQSL